MVIYHVSQRTTRINARHRQISDSMKSNRISHIRCYVKSLYVRNENFSVFFFWEILYLKRKINILVRCFSHRTTASKFQVGGLRNGARMTGSYISVCSIGKSFNLGCSSKLEKYWLYALHASNLLMVSIS